MYFLFYILLVNILFVAKLLQSLSSLAEHLGVPAMTVEKTPLTPFFDNIASQLLQATDR